MGVGGRVRILLVVAPLILPATVRALAPDVWPSFTQAQADEGKQLYADRCANCHGANLEGVGTPALTGASFIRRWAGGSKTVGDFYAKIRDTMPMIARRASAPGATRPAMCSATSTSPT